MKNEEKINFAVLKCMTQIPLTLEEVKMLEACSDTQLMESVSIDPLMLEKVRSWSKYEQRRFSSSFGTTPELVRFDNVYRSKALLDKTKK
jgi:hypothetical protein